jgi:hypothetical protein
MKKGLINNFKNSTIYSLFSATVNLIVNSVPLFLFSLSSPSNCSTREVTSCMPRLSRSSILRFSGMPTPLSEIVRMKLLLVLWQLSLSGSMDSSLCSLF